MQSYGRPNKVNFLIIGLVGVLFLFIGVTAVILLILSGIVVSEAVGIIKERRISSIQ